MQTRIGCGQITWRGVPADDVLADIAKAGYEGAPHGGKGTADEIRAGLAEHGLQPAPGYFGGDFWDASKYDEYVQAAGRYAAVAHQLGVTELYVSAGGFNTTTRAGRTRRDVAARATPEDALSDAEFSQLVRCVEGVARATLAEGVKSCYHNHVGTFVETEDEIERLLAAIDPEVLFLGPDTGHLAWAGVDVVEFARRHGTRIKTLHLKDIVASVREAGVAAGWDYSTFEANAVWTELGQGAVDFPGLLDVLDGNGFNGWLIVETDVTQLPTPLESAVVSRQYLRSLGH
ncbi:sugar phosphate isomerase/epimerase family protein [Flindersiella endophytica]